MKRAGTVRSGRPAHAAMQMRAEPTRLGGSEVLPVVSAAAIRGGG